MIYDTDSSTGALSTLALFSKNILVKNLSQRIYLRNNDAVDIGLPFENEIYSLVLFYPPHLIHTGDNRWLVKRDGTLNSDSWQEIIKFEFDEGMRVLKQTVRWHLSRTTVKYHC